MNVHVIVLVGWLLVILYDIFCLPADYGEATYFSCSLHVII